MLLPALYREDGRPRVVVLDNNSTHIDEVIFSAIAKAISYGSYLHIPRTSTRSSLDLGLEGMAAAAELCLDTLVLREIRGLLWA